MPTDPTDTYEAVLRDAQLALSSLESAKQRASQLSQDAKVSAGLLGAIVAVRFLLAALKEHNPDAH
jgi:hypothetical protein